MLVNSQRSQAIASLAETKVEPVPPGIPEPDKIFGIDVFGYAHPQTEERLLRLVPAGTQRRVEVVVAESHDPARAILQAAERFGVSVIVLGLPSPIITTTVRDVLSATHHASLLVPAPEN